MKRSSRILFGVLALSVGTFASSISWAGIECVDLSASGPAVFCTGESSNVGVTVTNSCETAMRLQFKFGLDDRPIVGKGSVMAPADKTVVTEASVQIGGRVMPGSHTLTLTASDGKGDETSTELEITVESCPK